MSHKTTTLTMLLLGSTTLSGSIFPTVSATLRVPAKSALAQKDKEKKGQQQMSGADSERETGRRALRRGEAGEALIHLENALRLYKGGDKWGEAATHDLLGELYEQQGRYGFALEHVHCSL
jgi:hypothetical protein